MLRLASYIPSRNFISRQRKLTTNRGCILSCRYKTTDGLFPYLFRMGLGGYNIHMMRPWSSMACHLFLALAALKSTNMSSLKCSPYFYWYVCWNSEILWITHLQAFTRRPGVVCTRVLRNFRNVVKPLPHGQLIISCAVTSVFYFQFLLCALCGLCSCVQLDT